MGLGRYKRWYKLARSLFRRGRASAVLVCLLDDRQLQSWEHVERRTDVKETGVRIAPAVELGLAQQFEAWKEFSLLFSCFLCRCYRLIKQLQRLAKRRCERLRMLAHSAGQLPLRQLLAGEVGVRKLLGIGRYFERPLGLQRVIGGCDPP
jgi:hypothetical protein